MNHDRYDNDLLKQLKRIADALERIDKNTKKPSITVSTDGDMVNVKLDATLYDQGLPCCKTCKESIVNSVCGATGRSLAGLDTSAVCCTEYKEAE